ncbi:ArfGap-domain-containing protein [Amylocystis lapponica]|nr:ArfGap-domain-containing protein [Amylocystis lapponica]
MDQVAARKTLQDLIKRDDLDNKRCVDCANPNPQWASISFAVFICLQCAGTHRGFGVHISFVRSVSMDTWQEEQIKRMQPHDTYHCWAASQYRQKLDAELAGNAWSPSPPAEGTRSPNNAASPPGRPSSAQGLRKSRASARSNSGRPQRGDSASPRGRYQGFGSTPSPSEHPSYGLSSRAAPSLAELQQNPAGALSKGWSLFSAAVAGASRVVSENVIQPGVEKVTDPNFQASVRGYATEAGKRATLVGRSANEWGKSTLGVDVAEQVGGVVGTVKDRVGGGPERRGYGRVSPGIHDGESSGLYDHGDEDDFFGEFNGGTQQQDGMSTYGAAGETPVSRSTAAPAKKQDDWDEWKDF